MRGARPLSAYPALESFLSTERAATVALPIDEVGIHAATVLYYHTADPLRFYFVTSRSSEKCRLLVENPAVNGACVVGTEPGTPFTLQMRGQFRIIDTDENKDCVEAYYQKRGNRKDDIVDADSVFLEFEPRWARFTDYAKGYDRYFLKIQKTGDRG